MLEFLKHNFVFNLDLTINAKKNKDKEICIYRCSFCNVWVAELKKYENEVCPKRDRRLSKIKDRRGRKWQSRPADITLRKPENIFHANNG